ncbi:MAG: alcohol dehydrogenase catalytic domain-containing protein [Ktedonobacterales bacterium]
MERQSLLLVAPHQFEWRSEKLPHSGVRDVLVQTIAGAVSIGTELPQYMGTERVTVAHGYPRMTGYESLGVVVARGSDVRDLQIGERVVAFYGHRTHAIVAQERAIRVPEGVSDALALPVILTCDVAKGIRKLAPHFHTNELSIVGSSDGWDYHQHAHWYFDVIREGAPELEALFEMDVAATDLPLTFERLARGEISPTKVLVRYAKAQS